MYTRETPSFFLTLFLFPSRFYSFLVHYRGTWVETQRVQHKRLQRQIDDSGTEIVAPNKRLNQERLEKLEAIGFAWSAKNTRKLKPPPAIPMTIPSPNNTSVVTTTTSMNKPKKGSPEEVASRTAAKTRLHDSQWEETFQRLLQYKEKYGVRMHRIVTAFLGERALRVDILSLKMVALCCFRTVWCHASTKTTPS